MISEILGKQKWREGRREGGREENREVMKRKKKHGEEKKKKPDKGYNEALISTHHYRKNL